MRNTQKTLYRIGAIINWVLLGIAALVFVIYSILLIVSIVNETAVTDDIGGMVGMLIWGALILVLLILVGKLEDEALQCRPNNLKAAILLIVFGVLAGNPLYIAGSIVGIIAGSQEANAEQPKEEPKEEEKAE